MFIDEDAVVRTSVKELCVIGRYIMSKRSSLDGIKKGGSLNT
jgi:hypothetical protein